MVAQVYRSKTEFQALLGCAMNSRTAWVGALKKFYEK